MAKNYNKKNKIKYKSNINKQTETKYVKKHKIFTFSILLFILIISTIAYYPALNNKFTNWDDGGYIVENLELKNLNFEGIKTQFSQYFMGNYHPLTMISLSVDFAIDKMNPKQYHLTNIICHLINILLVFWLTILLITKLKKEVINKNTIIIAGIVSVLFGIHTINVESVAWISERKNLLYTLFFLSSLIAYLKYIKSNNLGFYTLSILLFVLSSLSKGMAVSLTLTLIITDYFLNRNLLNKKVILEKIPYIILSIIFGIVAIYAQKSSNTIQSNTEFHFYERFLFAGYGFFQYLVKLILPVNLSFFYGYPEKTGGILPLEYYIYPIISLIIISGIIVYFRKSKSVIYGVAFFIVNIILVLQIIPVGYAVMADRYAYIPAIGFFFIIANIYKFITESSPKYKTLFISIIVIYMIILTYLSNQRSKTWYDGFSLWNAEIEQNPNSALAYKNRGRMKSDINDFKGAYEDFNKAVMINPKYGEAYNGRGMAKGNMNDLKGAIEDLNKAIFYYSNDQLSWNNRGIAKSILKDYKGAIYDFTRAIQIDSKFYKAYFNRALAKAEQKDYEGAIKDYNMTIKINPDYTDAYYNRGLQKFYIKDYEGAIKDFDKKLETNKNNGEIYFNRAIAKYYSNNKTGACEDWNMSFNMGYQQAGEMLKKYCK